MFDGRWETNEDGVYDATGFRSKCPQSSMVTGGIGGDEDCLHLSIYTPLMVLF